MNYYIKVILILSSVVFFYGCHALRSAEGLAGGELNVNYIAPLAGSVRYGVSDNIETRFTTAGERSNYDIFIHTRDSSKINFGLTFGVGTTNHIAFKYPFIVGTVSYRLNNLILPYVAVSMDGNIYDKSVFPYLAFGSDLKIYLNEQESIGIILTPEICVSKTFDSEFLDGNIFGSMNVGIILNVHNILGKK